MSYDDFHGSTFAVGTVTGLRAFSLESGRLYSPVQAMKWMPGENIAHCVMHQRPGAGSCGCGFYGYYDGSNDYYAPGRVAAIIEGYGKVTYGPKGFRCEKARIVALIVAGHVTGPPEKSWFKYVMSGYWFAMAIMWLVSGDMLGFWLDIFIGVMMALTFGVFGGVWGYIMRPRLRKVAKFYDVPLYATQRKALKHHPLTAPAELP